MSSSKRRIGLLAGAGMAAALALAGCGDKPEAPVQVVAELDGDVITAGEFSAYLALRGMPDRPGPARDRALRAYAERSAAARAIVAGELLEAEAIKAAQRHAANEALIERYLSQQIARASSDEEVEKYYKAYPEKFERTELNVSQIVFRVAPEASETDRQAKRVQAEKVREQLASGADFAKLAKRYSEDPITAGNGGERGWVDEQRLGRELWSAVKDLESDALSPALDIPVGIYIVKVMDRRVDKTSLEAAKESIRYRMSHEARAGLLKGLIDKADFKIVK